MNAPTLLLPHEAFDRARALPPMSTDEEVQTLVQECLQRRIPQFVTLHGQSYYLPMKVILPRYRANPSQFGALLRDSIGPLSNADFWGRLAAAAASAVECQDWDLLGFLAFDADLYRAFDRRRPARVALPDYYVPTDSLSDEDNTSSADSALIIRAFYNLCVDGAEPVSAPAFVAMASRYFACLPQQMLRSRFLPEWLDQPKKHDDRTADPWPILRMFVRYRRNDWMELPEWMALPKPSNVPYIDFMRSVEHVPIVPRPPMNRTVTTFSGIASTATLVPADILAPRETVQEPAWFELAGLTFEPQPDPNRIEIMTAASAPRQGLWSKSIDAVKRVASWIKGFWGGNS